MGILSVTTAIIAWSTLQLSYGFEVRLSSLPCARVSVIKRLPSTFVASALSAAGAPSLDEGGRDDQGSTFNGSRFSGEECSVSSPRRRATLAATSLLAAVATVAPTANAAETATKSTADVFYPSFYAGTWKVTREISESDDTTAFGGVNLPLTLVHEMRFVPYNAGGGSSPENGSDNAPVVADRAFNERSYYDALSLAVERAAFVQQEADRARVSAGLAPTTKPSQTLPAVRSLEWVVTNPSVLSVAYADGSSKEVRVTKRSCDVSKDGVKVFSTEFRQVVEVRPSSSSAGPSSPVVGGGIPVILGSRVLCKWKKVDDNVLEGLEILYNERGKLGSDAMGGAGQLLPPSFYGNGGEGYSDWRNTKSTIRLERL